MAQVNARFANATTPVQYEPHPEVGAGIMPTQFSFRVTAVATKKNNHPTEWMGGGPNQPPPWVWRADPDRSQVPPFELTVHGQKAPFVYDAALRQRFREAHDAIKLALDTLAPAASATVGSGVPAGGQTAADLAAADPDSRPFASPRFWAGFTITGWGGLPLRLRGDGGGGGAAVPG